MRKLLVPVSIAALAIAMTFPGAVTSDLSRGAATSGAVNASANDYYRNLVAPLADLDAGGQEAFDPAAKRPSSPGNASSDLQAWWAVQSKKHSGGFPRAAEKLGQIEAEAVRTGQNPRQIKQAKSTQQAQLLTVLVEFNPEANDDFSGFNRIIDINSEAGVDCVTEPAGTLLNGPLHNELGDPADFGTDGTPETIDNNTFWVPNFDADHYRDMIYTTEGITDRVRTDLTGLDGQPGFDISGYTMRNMYEEMSKGAYTIAGDVAGWVQLPHSEGWYGADSCEAGRASMVGHPDNPRDVSQMIVDAVDAIAAADPSFPWTDYDIEDQGDIDGDGNFFEPDGVIDHFVIVHAGSGEEGGGGPQGVYAVWSHASVVDPAVGGYTIPGTDVKVFNYIAQPEDAGVGVFAHEYGHDLGLPDLYDTSGTGESDVDFWDLMSTGSHSGPIFQSIPAHMGIWDKFVLGWADPQTFAVGSQGRTVQLGQTSNTPRGTKDGIRVNLPPKEINLATALSGTNMWYSNNDQDWADVKLARTLDVPAGTDVRFWLWNDYVIEDLWDYGFIEISTDGGATWAQQVVFDSTGAVVSTNDDPNGRLQDYGSLQNGLTGDSGGWRNDYVDLTPYAGTTIGFRLRHATDAAFLERGWFVDDMSVTADGNVVWSDDVESGLNDWTSQTGSFAGTAGAGWIIADGTFIYNHYYLAEWRNFDGFDLGLKYTYDSDYLRFDTGEWSVQRVAYNAPAMLVWYRNIQYSVNHVTVPVFDLPSTGSKGMLLLVDSHFDPLRRTGEAAAQDPTTLKNIASRPQSSNAGFTTQPTYPFTECLESPDLSYDLYCTDFAALPGVSSFNDRQGWYPGLEFRGGGLFFRDIDASVVIPSRDHQLYTTRIVDPDGNPVPGLYGLDLGGIVLGTGNPADGNLALENPVDLSMGVGFEIMSVGKDNTFVRIKVDPAD
ncbi:MAG: immune inhibitor A domain-containing protein [Chloroflexota bacterium]